VDHAKIPNEAQWDELLDELDDHVAMLRKHSRTARLRAREKTADGYPANSMPEGSTGGVGGDPTGNLVAALAGGQEAKDGKPATDDTWAGVKDPIAQSVRQMIHEATDARNRLRGATAAMGRALPVTIPDVPREVCVSCGVSKKVAKRWVQAEGRCESCSRRERRRGKGSA
jgi:hypothetical protein